MSMTPTLTASNVLEGPVYVYFGASCYADTPDVMPADTVAFGGTPGGTWVSAGFTSEDGIQEHFEVDRGAVMTAQQRTPILRPLNSTTHTLTGTLLEVTLPNLAYILGLDPAVAITHVAPGAGAAGHDELRISDPAGDPIAILIEGKAPPLGGGMPRRILYPAVSATGTVEPLQRQGEDGATAGVAFEFSRVGGVESEVIIRDVLAPAA